MGKSNKRKYGKGVERESRRIAAPELSYEPHDPKRYNPAIGLIGCGGISEMHLRAYKQAGYNVVALCNRHVGKAEARRQEFFPKASVCSDYREILKRDDIEVVDILTHPEIRYRQIEEALRAGKHVLSQKPFVTDLRRGEKLVNLAEKMRVKLAVNHNGRWAPHFSYIRNALAKGLVGDVLAAHFSVQWNHDWVAGTKFDEVRHLVLYDFGIHWFDMLTCFMRGKLARRVYASVRRGTGQQAKPPLLGEAIVEYDNAQASVVFDGFTQRGASDTTRVIGSKGSISSTGPDFDRQTVTLHTSRGWSRPRLRGNWFPGGFHGAMGELLCAIEEKRTPSNDARTALEGLALCFAAARSADTNRPQVPGKVLSISM